MNRVKLEDFTLDRMWELYLVANPPPPHLSAEDISGAKILFAAGTAGAALWMDRMLQEPEERRRGLLAQLLKDSSRVLGFTNDS